MAGAVGFAAVAEELSVPGALEREVAVARSQADRLRVVAMTIPGVETYGPLDASMRLPHLLCLGVGGVEAEAVLVGLDQAGVAAHSGSACASEGLEPSPVLQAMGVEAERSLRLSVGWSTNDEDVERAAAALPRVVRRLRDLTGAPARGHSSRSAWPALSSARWSRPSATQRWRIRPGPQRHAPGRTPAGRDRATGTIRAPAQRRSSHAR